MTGDLVVRPMLDADVTAANRLAAQTFDDLDASLGEPPHTPWDDPARVAKGERRARTAVATDPGGCLVAEDASGLLGVAIALRRGGLWVLSLLTVRPGEQGRGVGARLLEAARRTEEGATAGLIFSSRDPRALRRYQRAGYTLHPAYKASGPVDRSLLPAGLDVRDGSHDDDADLLEAVSRHVRGVPHTPDLGTLALQGNRLLVADGAGGRGFALLGPEYVTLCAATGPEVARRLLWAALAEIPDGASATVAWLTAAQPWAVDVVLDARLPLSPGSSVCTRGDVGPMAPYLPSGVYG